MGDSAHTETPLITDFSRYSPENTEPTDAAAVFRADVLAIADDLSGAAEAAAALLPGCRSARIELPTSTETLAAHNTQHDGRPALAVADLDCRNAPGAEAERSVHATLAARPAAKAFLKIDSLLRGNVRSMLAAARPAVLAPALPPAGRTVHNGVLHVSGRPLHRSGQWSAESAAPAATIAEALAPQRCRVITLDVVRSGRLRETVRDCLEAGEIPLCDGETDADLDAVVAACADLPGVRLAGSGGLATALGRAMPEVDGYGIEAPDSAHGLLFAIGTAEAASAEQVRRLATRGVQQIPLDVPVLLAQHDESDRIARALRHSPVAVTLQSPHGVNPAHSREIVRRLAETAAHAVRSADRPVDLVLTGGETARRVLDALGMDELVPLTQIHHGAVRSRTRGGTSVVTRPGSFGDADSLVRIAEHLRPATEG